jgi:hypothetical protein
MRSRLNSTGRQKITPAMASFILDGAAEEQVTFSAQIDLSSLSLQENGAVVVEAYRQSLFERFEFGTVAVPAPARPLQLRTLRREALQFRMKVVEPRTGKLLARGDRLNPVGAAEAGRSELLRTITRDLGPEPWRTELTQAGQPVLVLNENITAAASRIKTDREFQSLILPAALRQVLLVLWAKREEEEDEPEENDWVSRWLVFAELVSGQDRPDWREEEDVQDWINEVCQAFCKKFDFMSVLGERRCRRSGVLTQSGSSASATR